MIKKLTLWMLKVILNLEHFECIVDQSFLDGELLVSSFLTILGIEIL